MVKRVRIGVLALQGAFIEHIASLSRLKVEAIPVKLPHLLDEIDGLIIPGGESTTIWSMMKRYGFVDKIRDLARSGFPIFGTCAGMILLAKRVFDFSKPALGVMDLGVRRNAFGRQIASFECCLSISCIGREPFNCIFIRAPQVVDHGDRIQVLASLEDGTIVAAQQENLLVTSFHPELTEDMRMHDYFLRFVCRNG